MATTKLYLDIRSKNTQGLSSLKICITNKGASAYIPTGIRLNPKDWDKKKLQVRRISGSTELNNSILAFKLKVDKAIAYLQAEGLLFEMPATKIKDRVLDIIDPKKKQERLLLYNFRKFIESRNTDSTKRFYIRTMRKIKDFDSKAEMLYFDDINYAWLLSFDEYMKSSGLSNNGRINIIKELKSVFNYAIDNEITQNYPFRKLKIRKEMTAKRSLTVQQLRQLFDFKASRTTQKYIDIFKLTFFLIGINMKDLCYLRNIENGYIKYNRAKTGRFYCIKVQPEAKEIIEKYKGKNYLLCIMDKYKDYSQFNKLLAPALKAIANKAGLGLPQDNSRIKHTGFSPYWARHTWATIAASLDIPKETIAQALGHGGYNVTDVYINFDRNKIDIANRQVIDFVLYNKRPN